MKRDRAKTEGVAAWVSAEEYAQFIARLKRAFDNQVARELNANE